MSDNIEPTQELIFDRMNIQPEEQDVVNQLISKTNKTTLNSIRQKINRRRQNSGQPPLEGDTTSRRRKIAGIKEYHKEEAWTIDCENSRDQFIVFYSENMCCISEQYFQDYNISTIISVLHLDADVDLKELRKYRCGSFGTPRLPPTGFAKIALSGKSTWDYEPHNHHLDPDGYDSSGCDSELDEVDTSIHFEFESRPVSIEMNRLSINGLTEELFIKYLIALVQPAVENYATKELDQNVQKLIRRENTVDISPEDGIWLSIWKLHLNM